MRQMLEQSYSLPKGVTTDYPVYPMRGFMLDVGHKYSSSDNAIFIWPIQVKENLIPKTLLTTPIIRIKKVNGTNRIPGSQNHDHPPGIKETSPECCSVAMLQRTGTHFSEGQPYRLRQR